MSDELPPLSVTLSAVLGRPFRQESRAPLEFARLRRTDMALSSGAGRRVVLVTGYLAGSNTTKPLATVLDP